MLIKISASETGNFTGKWNRTGIDKEFTYSFFLFSNKLTFTMFNKAFGLQLHTSAKC